MAGGKRHPAQMGQAEVEAFLTRLATDGRVSAGTQNQRWLRCCFFTAKCCASSCRGWKTWYAPSGPGGFR
ncbi:phage integrase N-terminal SAM-like domain-containing protein [Xanthomonas phaseoli pv. phaseoli]|nr:phage integrase N-terminal SAM-like domain-containing protein [Xanthomonas phaseoli pv. phaseoli]